MKNYCVRAHIVWQVEADFLHNSKISAALEIITTVGSRSVAICLSSGAFYKILVLAEYCFYIPNILIGIISPSSTITLGLWY